MGLGDSRGRVKSPSLEFLVLTSVEEFGGMKWQDQACSGPSLVPEGESLQFLAVAAKAGKGEECTQREDLINLVVRQ